MVRTDRIAERYADAIYDLATERQQTEALNLQFATLVNWLENDSHAKSLLSSAASSKESKSETLMAAGKAINASETLSNALQVIAANGRADKVTQVQQAIAARWAKDSNQMVVSVSSAKPLDSTTRKSVVKILSEAQDADVTLEETVDPSLIGGLRVQIGSKLIDGSVLTRLNAMKHVMRAG